MGLERFDCGASNPTLNRNHVHQIPVSFPCIEEQRRIASILSAYDDLIENNTRRIKILEEIAQSLYGEWFVHFRFPGHEKVPMADSALGPAPEGWVTQPLEAVCKRITDGSHWSPETVPGEQLMASSKDMHRWGLNRSTCRSIAKEDFASLVRNDCQPRAGDILITKDGANYLKYCFVVESDLDLVILSSIAVIRPNPLLGCSHFLALYLSDPDVKARLAANVSGAAIPRIVLKDFSRFTIMVPPIEIQRTFEGLVEPLASLCWRLVDKNVNLRATRDLLLPKLISGEILIEAADDQASKALEQVA
jgi:type I restriction enzyme S subunit